MLQTNRVAAWITLLSFVAAPCNLSFAATRSGKKSRVASESTAVPAEDTTDTSSSDSSGETLISPGFLLQISSGSDGKLSGTFRVQPTGKVDLPYNVSVNTKGMTLAKFRARLAKDYADYFTGTPNVQATIRQKRYWIEVLGLVAKPGDYLVKQDSPLDEIISLAGGLTDDLTTGYVRIVQPGQPGQTGQSGQPSAAATVSAPVAAASAKTSWVDLSEYYKGRATEVPSWVGADRIFFQKERPDFAADQFDAEATHKIEILGEVRNPGELTYRKEADIYYYLVKTGGPTSLGDLDKVEVVRTDRGTGERKQLSLGPVGEIKGIQGGDIMIFHPVRTTSLERTLTITAIVTSIVSASLLAYVAVKQANR